MATPAAVAATPVSAPVRRRRLRFVTNPKAMVGLILMGIFVLLAIIGRPAARLRQAIPTRMRIDRDQFDRLRTCAGEHDR